MRRRIVRFVAGVAAVLALPLATTLTSPVHPAAAAAGAPSAFTALATPVRLADTRTTGAFSAGAIFPVAVTGAAPLPAVGTITAAVLNVTVVGPAQPGYWTV